MGSSIGRTETASMSINRKKLRLRLFLASSLLALVGVLAAIGAGFSPHRLWPIADFLLVWAGSATYIALANKASRRRAFRLRNVPVPRGVRLRKPIWIRLETFLTLICLGAIVGTIAAAIGLPGVGLGIALVPAAIGAFTVFTGLFGPSDLTFESSGLRLHIGSGHCLVPWASVKEIEGGGTGTFALIRVTITDPNQVVDSVSPDTPRNRRRVERLLFQRLGTTAEILLGQWTAGLDGELLFRAIREGMAGRPPQMN
jgi:hypothetical protein